MTLRPLLLCLLPLALAGPVRAQVPLPPLPGHGPAPLLAVRFSGPPGLRATFYPGRAPARGFNAPVVVGLRPGYLYRVALSGLPGHPGITLYPTLEVRGTLGLPPRVAAACYPAPVVLTEADISAALAGTLVTKVIYLEHPDRAVPVATTPDEPLQTEMPPQRDLVKEASERGRALLVVRLGDGLPAPEDILRCAVAGTILFPGEKVLMPAAGPPCLPWGDRPFYDPYLGPRHLEEECLHDGGDRGEKAGLDAHGQLRGLDPEDTVAEYTDSKGRRRLTCSNTVCLCVPRFAVLRSELPPALSEGVVGPTPARKVLIQNQLRLLLPPELTRQAKPLVDVTGRLRPSVNINAKVPGELVGIQVLQAHEIVLGPIELLGTVEMRKLTEVQRAVLARQLQLVRELSVTVNVAGTEQIVGTQVVGRVVGGPEVVTAEVPVYDLTVCCHEAPCPPDKPLLLVKCADRTSAKVGDVVTFSLRYSNHGGRPMTDVAVSDSLSGRLEYVPGSAESDRDAVFTTQVNEAGSLILRWEVSGKLLPGESGRLRFKARVR
jgi:uncharacterized repeat protein (TIGR01451 family)